MRRTKYHGARRIERSAVTAVVPVLVMVPFWLLSMAVYWLPLSWAFGVAYWHVAAGWLIFGLLLISPEVQALVLGSMLGARRPFADEHDHIMPVWEAVATDARQPSSGYRLRVIDSPDLNAFACGGHLLVVTSFALQQLTKRQLAGVLAHELSHHLGLHTVALTVGHWLSVPVIALARIGFFLQNVATAATTAFAADSPVLTALGKVLAAIMHGFSWVFLAALYLSDIMNNWVGYRAEFEADHTAVELGYGKHLAEALGVLIATGRDVGAPSKRSWMDRIHASHPPARTRVTRIEAHLRTRKRARQRSTQQP